MENDSPGADAPNPNAPDGAVTAAPAAAPDDRRLLISQRDESKRRARQLEAELAAARERLAETEGARAEIGNARAQQAITECVDAKMHKAAAAILSGYDCYSLSPSDIRSILQEHGLVTTRNTPTGMPGANHRHLSDEEKPGPHDPERERVRALAKRESARASADALQGVRALQADRGSMLPVHRGVTEADVERATMIANRLSGKK